MTPTFDAVLGARLHELRKQRSISLSDMAAEIGVSYQQMQKYEAGTNSLSVGRLIQFSRLLKVDPRKFLDAEEQELHSDGEDDGNTSAPTMNLIGERARLRKAYFSLPLETRYAFLRLLEAAASS